MTALRVLAAYGLAWALQPVTWPAAVVCSLLAHQWNAEQRLPEDGPQGGENSVDEDEEGAA